MSAEFLKERLRADLKRAMQQRAQAEIGVLRALVAALDNAEAVPGDGVQDNMRPRMFGDPGGERPRRVLDQTATEAVLAHEIESRENAAAAYELHGRVDEAQGLLVEVLLIRSYLGG